MENIGIEVRHFHLGLFLVLNSVCLFVGKPDKPLVVFHETRMVTDQALGLGSNNDEN